MQNSKKFFLAFTLAVVFFCAQDLFAETIRLKDGRSVEGKIVEKTDQYIKVSIGEAVVTYFNDEIAGIDQSQAVVDISAAGTGGELYVDEESGFEISGPLGWLKRVGKTGEDARVIFYKTKAGTKMKYPFIGVAVDYAPAGVKTALDFVNWVLPEYKKSAESMQAAFNLVEPAHEVEVNGNKGARFVFEQTGPGGRNMKSLDCKFIRGDLVVSIQGMDYIASFSDSLSDFEAAIRSFKFREAKEPAAAGGTRKFSLRDLLASGEKVYGVYKNSSPGFTLNIPADTIKKWYFVVFPKPEGPFYIVTDTTFSKDLPFISSMIGWIPAEKLSRGKAELFQKIALEHQQWEKRIFGEDINFINNGAPVKIKDLAAFERITEVPGSNIKHHLLYIFLDEYLLQIGLNTSITDFAQDDKDFMSIINTL